MSLKQSIKVAIDSPAAAGAGTQAKLISKHYNLFYLDTGKIYRVIAYFKIKNPKKFNYKHIRKKIRKLKIKDLQNKKLLNNEVGTIASIISSFWVNPSSISNKDSYLPREFTLVIARVVCPETTSSFMPLGPKYFITSVGLSITNSLFL